MLWLSAFNSFFSFLIEMLAEESLVLTFSFLMSEKRLFVFLCIPDLRYFLQDIQKYIYKFKYFKV